MRHHYRGAKLALWLDLIPRIHRSDSLNVKYHLLDHYDNRSSFEDEGTKELRLNNDDVQDTTMTSSSSAAAATATEESVKMTMTMMSKAAVEQPQMLDSAIPTTTKLHRANGTAQLSLYTTAPRLNTISSSASFFSAAVVYTTARKATTRARPTTTPLSNVFTPRLLVSNPGGGGSVKDLNLPLSVTIAVGCTLLLLNILIFIVTYRQKSKKDKVSADMDDIISKGQGATTASAATGMGLKMAADESDNFKSSTGPDSDTNSSISSFSARLAAEESRQVQQQQQHHHPHHHQQQNQLPRNVHFSSTTLTQSPSPASVVIGAPCRPTPDGPSSYVTLPSSRRPPAVPARQTTPHLLSSYIADERTIRHQSSIDSKQNNVTNNGIPSTTV